MFLSIVRYESAEDGPLLMDEFGHSRIYEMFLANVRYSGHEELIGKSETNQFIILEL